MSRRIDAWKAGRAWRGALIALILPAVAGCAMKLNGFISDAQTGKAISGARIRVGELLTYSDVTGAYLLKIHREPQVTAEISAPGYDVNSVTCDTPTRLPVCDVQLVPKGEFTTSSAKASH